MEFNGFGQRLRSACERREINGAEFARQIGKLMGKEPTRASVNDWFQERHYPKADQLFAICTILNESADHLLFNDISKAIDKRVVAAKEALVGLSPQQKQDLLRLLLPELNTNS